MQFYLNWEENNSLSYLVNIFKNVARKKEMELENPGSDNAFLSHGFKKDVIRSDEQLKLRKIDLFYNKEIYCILKFHKH